MVQPLNIGVATVPCGRGGGLREALLQCDDRDDSRGDEATFGEQRDIEQPPVVIALGVQAGFATTATAPKRHRARAPPNAIATFALDRHATSDCIRTPTS
jgi:hypothetical protein